MALKDNYIKSPAFTDVNRRSLPIDSGDVVLTGRWVKIDTDGKVAYPGASAKAGLYWVLEGERVHVGSITEFVTSTGVSTNYTSLPSSVASLTITGVSGSFVGVVGVEGVDHENTTSSNYDVGTLLTVDQYGRLVKATAAENVNPAIAATFGDTPFARVEAVTRTGAVPTSLTFRTFGN